MTETINQNTFNLRSPRAKLVRMEKDLHSEVRKLVNENDRVGLPVNTIQMFVNIAIREKLERVKAGTDTLE